MSSLVNKEKFCIQMSELKFMQNNSYETNKNEILQFRIDCEELFN
jgi:hypothetical protein